AARRPVPRCVGSTCRSVALVAAPVNERLLDGLERLSSLGQAGDFGFELLATRLGAAAASGFVSNTGLQVGDLGGAQVKHVARLVELTGRRLPLGVALGEGGLDLCQQARLLSLQASVLGELAEHLVALRCQGF